MSEAPVLPTWDQIVAYPWETAASEAETPTPQEISSVLFKWASEADSKGDGTGALVYRFIGQLLFMHLEPSNPDTPFRAAIIMQTKRSAALEDYDPVALDLVRQLADVATSPALRARFCDLIWVSSKDHSMAALAAESYLATFKLVDSADEWVRDIDGLQRGMDLARILGGKKPTFIGYVEFIETRLATLESICEDAYGARLLALLADHKAGDLAKSAKIAEAIADRLESAGPSFLAEDYYDWAARFHQMRSDPAAAKKIGIKKGESLVALAFACVDRPGQRYLSATHHLAKGVECLRQSNAEESRVKTLHATLLEWQEKATGEMKSFHHETDVSELVEHTRKRLEGKSLREAILLMALGHPVIDTEKLRQRVIENADKFPMSTMFGGVMMARDGRVMAHKPSGFTTDAAAREEFIEAEMFHQAAQIDWNMRAQAYIDVCRREIWLEHRPTLDDLQFLVLQNPFIPPGHEGLFLKAIAAGFRGDLDIVTHFLVPQIEEMIRHILRRAGHITSKLDAKLIQEQRLLGTLLAMPETEEMLGKDHIFELRGLLCEKFGHDLRNRLAHGFVTHSDCWTSEVLNVWWLVIRFLCFPIAQMQSGEPKQVGDEVTDE